MIKLNYAWRINNCLRVLQEKACPPRYPRERTYPGRDSSRPTMDQIRNDAYVLLECLTRDQNCGKYYIIMLVEEMRELISCYNDPEVREYFNQIHPNYTPQDLESLYSTLRHFTKTEHIGPIKP